MRLVWLAGASFQEHIPYHNIENDRVGTDGTKTNVVWTDQIIMMHMHRYPEDLELAKERTLNYPI